MNRGEPGACLNQYPEVPKFQDYCPNGLQVEVRKIVRGVTSSLALPAQMPPDCAAAGTPVHRYSGSCLGAPRGPGFLGAAARPARQNASCTVSSGVKLRKARGSRNGPQSKIHRNLMITKAFFKFYLNLPGRLCKIAVFSHFPENISCLTKR
jgi:hypothetical protein